MHDAEPTSLYNILFFHNSKVELLLAVPAPDEESASTWSLTAVVGRSARYGTVVSKLLLTAVMFYHVVRFTVLFRPKSYATTGLSTEIETSEVMKYNENALICFVCTVL